jgi:hypothetical protein
MRVPHACSVGCHPERREGSQPLTLPSPSTTRCAPADRAAPPISVRWWWRHRHGQSIRRCLYRQFDSLKFRLTRWWRYYSRAFRCQWTHLHQQHLRGQQRYPRRLGALFQRFPQPNPVRQQHLRRHRQSDCRPLFPHSQPCIFTPSAHASSSGLLQIVTQDSGSSQSTALSGKGVIPVISLPAGPLTFSAQQVGTTSTQQPVTVNNTGQRPSRHFQCSRHRRLLSNQRLRRLRCSRRFLYHQCHLRPHCIRESHRLAYHHRRRRGQSALHQPDRLRHRLHSRRLQRFHFRLRSRWFLGHLQFAGLCAQRLLFCRLARLYRCAQHGHLHGFTYCGDSWQFCRSIHGLRRHSGPIAHRPPHLRKARAATRSVPACTRVCPRFTPVLLRERHSVAPGQTSAPLFLRHPSIFSALRRRLWRWRKQWPFQPRHAERQLHTNRDWPRQRREPPALSRSRRELARFSRDDGDAPDRGHEITAL